MEDARLPGRKASSKPGRPEPWSEVQRRVQRFFINYLQIVYTYEIIKYQVINLK